MQLVKEIRNQLNHICRYSQQIIVFSFWLAVILFALEIGRAHV